ncbi:Shedu immune nuclease family protein [Paraburkholderia domus]|uniref:Shedu immune nuclease family protein n=1 Tax=Paraburkholderia domus TaxID=2793075 RepID=UPI00191421DC|nr:Shedu immune nuclease family protein [Paraburkholderia domus]MBK5061771.1 DUF4263 domain-containing protein [Burkholderia sp. R-70199]
MKLSEGVEGSVDVLVIDAALASTILSRPERPSGVEQLLNIHPECLTIWPLEMRSDRDDYMGPKYGNLKCIRMMRRVAWEYPIPNDADDVEAILERLPTGFSKDFRSGLGLLWEYRFICEAIAEIPGIDTLTLHGSYESPVIAPPELMIGVRTFEDLRKELYNIGQRHQRRTRNEKRYVAYDRLLHRADKAQYPRKRQALEVNAIADLTRAAGGATRLSKQDQQAVVRLVKSHKEELAKTESHALLELKADIELVTLKELINVFDEKLQKTLPERSWQEFFQANSFVLGLAFSIPFMVIQDNPYVGGTRFHRRGGKIADFLVAAESTGNLAIIEIKKPSTDLVSKAPYRDDVHGLSTEMSGAVAQILDQRFKLQKHLPNLKEDSDRNDIHGYAVRCIVIAGSTPQTTAERKSFELLRNSMSQCTIVTFDELLGRLKQIYAAFSAPDQPPFDQTDLPF